MQRKIVIPTVLLIVVLAGSGAFAFLHGSASKNSAAPPASPPVPVVAGTVAQHDVPIYLTGVGTVIAYNTVIIRSQIQGQIVSINFTEGQAVHTGDLLAQIDPRPYQAQIDQMTAKRDRDQAQLVNAQANLDRYTPLESKGYATPQLVDTQKAQVAQLQNASQSGRGAHRSGEGATQLHAPDVADRWSGRHSSDRHRQYHQPVKYERPRRRHAARSDFADLHSPGDSSAANPAATAKNQAPLAVLAYSQDNTIKLDEGALGLVNNEILQTTGSIQLKANFPNKAHRLWPGELVNARLLLDTRHDGLTVPASVVQQGPKGAYAYVINPDNTVAIRPIKVAQISDGQALIDSGLKANEQVVVDGQYKLQPGTHVTILHGQAAEEAAAQSALQAPIP